MFSRTTLSSRVARLESEVAGIRRLYDKTLDYGRTDPETALMNARKAAEAVCARVFEHKVGKPPKSLTLQPLIEKLSQLDAAPEQILIALRTIQNYGNFGSHHQTGEPQPITPEFAQPCLQALGTVVRWYCEDFEQAEYGAQPVSGSGGTTVPTASGWRGVPIWLLAGATLSLVLAITLYQRGFVNQAGLRSTDVAQTDAPRPPIVEHTNGPATDSPQPFGDWGWLSPFSRGVSVGVMPAPQHIPSLDIPSLVAVYFSNAKPRLAVLPFRCSVPAQPDASALADELTASLTSRLTQSNLVSLVERDQLNRVFEELDLSRSSRFNHAEVAKIGRLLGAKQLLIGSFFQDAKAMRLDARIVDTETASVLASAIRKGKPNDDSLIGGLSDDIVKALEEASQQAAQERR